MHPRHRPIIIIVVHPGGVDFINLIMMCRMVVHHGMVQPAESSPDIGKFLNLAFS